jgi:nitroreductase
METLDALMTRRSIRRFRDEPVPEETIEQLLRAAMAAPSAFNEQAWRFVVVTESDTLEELSRATAYAGPMAGAAVGVVVCGDLSAERHPGRGYWTLDCSAAMENLLVAANGSGLGAVWLGVYPWQDRAENVRTILGLPDDIEPLGMAAIGWPAEEKEPASRYDESYVHRERW